MHCANCQAENPPEFKFCGECGTPLSCQPEERKAWSVERKNVPVQEPLIAPGSAFSASQTAPEAERRQLTVMFCDLIGFTPLAEKLDPEDLQEVIRAYQEGCAAVVRRFDGYIARYAGDALLVYFGYPIAHEDDAQRAVRTGLEIVAALPHLKVRIQESVGPIPDFSLQVRIGIHTGVVVVGEMGSRDYRESMALGGTPNIAARLQETAPPDTVMIGAMTHRLIEGLFECQDLGYIPLKGVSIPLRAYRVVRESDVQSRFEVAVTAGLAPLVGRAQELNLLWGCWEQAKRARGQVVLLNGEAGIGKSHLVQGLKEQIAGEIHARVEGRCSPYAQNSAFYPVIGLLQHLLRVSREEPPQEKLSKLEGMLEQGGFPLAETVPLFAALLSLPLSNRYSPLTLTPQRQRQQTLQVLLTWLLTLASHQPVLLVGEDLQWMDPSSLELLNLLIERIPQSQILLLLTYRPEFRPPWEPRSYQTQIELNRLSSKDAKVLIERVSRGKPLPEEVVKQIVIKTDGIPLFVEELTKMILESSLLHEENDRYILTKPLPPLAIPSTLHDSLMARLDRLATAKETAQWGATLGREFTYELIEAVSPPKATLQRDLDTLVDATLLLQRDRPPKARYVFKHALIQEAAYQSLLKRKRQQYHEHIAKTLEEHFPELKETQPELLAHHCTEANLLPQAIPYWQRAGRRAAERSAHEEAIHHLTKGLELLSILPNTVEHAQQELTLRIALGGPLIAAKGYGAVEVEKTYARARDLCQQLGNPPQLIQVLLGLEAFYSVRGEFQTAHHLGEQCLLLARRLGDPTRLLQAHWTLGQILFHLGEFVPAQEHVEKAMALYDPQRHSSRVLQDLKVTSLCYLAWAAWQLGYPNQALDRGLKALALAHELSHPFSIGFALIFVAAVHQLRGEWQATREHAAAAIALCTEQGFPVWLAFGTVLHGWVLTRQGQEWEGITQMRQGLAAWRATGAEASLPLVLALLAGAYGRVGQVVEGLGVLEEGLAIAHKNRERYYEAELYRLKGELLLRNTEFTHSSLLSTHRSAEKCFQQALAVARRQQAKAWELRAAMSLGRLWAQQGKQEEAKQLLADVYGWFAEGFDTADLQEARSLVVQWSGHPFAQQDITVSK